MATPATRFLKFSNNCSRLMQKPPCAVPSDPAAILLCVDIYERCLDFLKDDNVVCVLNGTKTMRILFMPPEELISRPVLARCLASSDKRVRAEAHIALATSQPPIP